MQRTQFPLHVKDLKGTLHIDACCTRVKRLRGPACVEDRKGAAHHESYARFVRLLLSSPLAMMAKDSRYLYRDSFVIFQIRF